MPNKVKLTEDERAAIVNALTEKASDDDKRAAELEKAWPEASRDQVEGYKRLALTFRNQVKNERALVEKLENFDAIELV